MLRTAVKNAKEHFTCYRQNVRAGKYRIDWPAIYAILTVA